MATSELAGEDDAGDEVALNATEATDGDGGDDEDVEEFVGMDANVSYLAPILRIFAMLHTITAFAMMIAYYQLKVCAQYKSIILLFTISMSFHVLSLTHLFIFTCCYNQYFMSYICSIEENNSTFGKKDNLNI